MTSPLAAIADLRAAAAELALSDSGRCRRVGRRLQRYLQEAPLGLALELPIGGEPWWTFRDPLETRNALIAEIARVHFPGQSPWQAAGGIEAELRQYRRAQYWHDLDRGHSEAPAGSLRARLFDLAAFGRLPRQKQIANILRAAADEQPQVVDFSTAVRK